MTSAPTTAPNALARSALESASPASGPSLGSCAVPLVHPEKVAIARAAAPSVDESVDLAAMFRLLGDPARTRILYALLEVGELCVCDIAATVDISETSASQALRLLRTARIVAGRRAGRMVFYRLADAHVRMLLDLSREHARHDTGGYSAANSANSANSASSAANSANSTVKAT